MLRKSRARRLRLTLRQLLQQIRLLMQLLSVQAHLQVLWLSQDETVRAPLLPVALGIGTANASSTLNNKLPTHMASERGCAHGPLVPPFRT